MPQVHGPRRRSVRLVLGALAAAAAFAAAPSSAYRASPLIHHLTPTGSGSSSFVTIENPHDYPLTLLFTMTNRRVRNGEVVSDEVADDVFTVFPPQAIVHPGKTQRVQFRYVGGPVEASEVYRFKIEQVPVDLSGSGTAINMAFDFIARVFVAAPGTAPRLEVTDVRPNGNGYSVTVRNDGDHHAEMANLVWHATGPDGTQVELDSDVLDVGAFSLLEPGGTGSLDLPKAMFGALTDVKTVTASAPPGA